MFKTSQQAYRSQGALGFATVAGTSADVTGSAIDRMQVTSGQQGYQACRAILTTGLISGTAGAYARLVCEDSSTGTDGWAALVDPATGTQYVSGTIGTAAVTGEPAIARSTSARKREDWLKRSPPGPADPSPRR